MGLLESKSRLPMPQFSGYHAAYEIIKQKIKFKFNSQFRHIRFLSFYLRRRHFPHIRAHQE